ncbi:MAG: ATP synthase F1 subunit delta [Clostridia bacterium]|nr:ATP synthase F1 subunit delta [Clostridia bacterium]
MRDKTVSKRYAQALLSLAQDKNQIEEYRVQLNQVLETLDTVPILQYIWYNEQLPASEKKEIIKKYFDGKLMDISINFLCILVDKNREKYLKGIIQEYEQIAHLSNNILEIKVGSAVQLSEKDYYKLKDRFAAITGKEIRINLQIMPELIGGIIVKIGDKVIDGSVRKRLALLEKNLQVSNHRDSYLQKFISEPKELSDISEETLVAEVQTAVQMSDKAISQLEEKLSAKMGKNVKLHTKIVPSLIGGSIIKIGDKVIDGSVKKRLALLEEDIMKVIQNWGEELSENTPGRS